MSGTKQIGRLESVDVLRGLDMFFITGGCGLLCGLSTLVTGADGGWVARQMTHVEWAGLHVLDVIFPLFLFIAGVTFPLSTASRLARGESRADVARNAVRRMLTLVILGALFEHVQNWNWPEFRVWSVIGRIGIVWAAAGLLTLYCRRRTCVIVTAVILVGWWLLLRLVPSPSAAAGVDPLACEANCLVTWVDSRFLTTAHRFEGGLATVAMLPTAFFGIWCGEALRAQVKARVLAAVGVAMILVGIAWSLPSWGFPVIKNIWSGSFALVVGGISVLLLALCHWVVDVNGCAKWAIYFKIIGVNAIAVYLSQEYVPWESIGRTVLGALGSVSSLPGWNETVGAVGRLGTAAAVLTFLYRHRIFFKV